MRKKGKKSIIIAFTAVAAIAAGFLFPRDKSAPLKGTSPSSTMIDNSFAYGQIATAANSAQATAPVLNPDPDVFAWNEKAKKAMFNVENNMNALTAFIQSGALSPSELPDDFRLPTQFVENPLRILDIADGSILTTPWMPGEDIDGRPSVFCFVYDRTVNDKVFVLHATFEPGKFYSLHTESMHPLGLEQLVQSVVDGEFSWSALEIPLNFDGVRDYPSVALYRPTLDQVIFRWPEGIQTAPNQVVIRVSDEQYLGQSWGAWRPGEGNFSLDFNPLSRKTNYIENGVIKPEIPSSLSPYVDRIYGQPLPSR